MQPINYTKAEEALDLAQKAVNQSAKALNQSAKALNQSVIDESGKDFIKFIDGTLVCYDHIYLKYEGNSDRIEGTANFRRSFAGSPVVTVSMEITNNDTTPGLHELSEIRIAEAETDHVTIQHYHNKKADYVFQSGDKGTYHYMAIGRWK